MSIAVVVLTLVLLAVVIAVVSRPLLREHPRKSTLRQEEQARTPKDEPAEAQNDARALRGASERHAADGSGERSDPSGAIAMRREELEAAREAKYREIRDTELDYRTGKLSLEDYEAVNGTLRAEAVEILDQLDALEQQRRARDGEDDPMRGRPSGPSTRVS